MSSSSDANRSGAYPSALSIIPIIVGTMSVWVTECCSMRPGTPAGSNSGIDTIVPPITCGIRSPAIDAAWNIGVWIR